MKLKYIYIAITATVLFTSCKKLIDQPYDNRLELKAAADYEGLVIQAYPERQDMFTDILTDDYHHYAGTMQASMGPRYLPIFMYKDDYQEGTAASPQPAYAHYYSKIYLVNNVIEEVMKGTGDETYKKAIRGEALMIRAYCYFSLVNLFGMHYNPATSANDLGVPLLTEVATANRPTFPRSTVKEIYDQIDKDMTEGLSLMKAGSAFLRTNPYRFSLISANAFIARVNLYKGNWEETVKYANQVVQEKGIVVRDLDKDITILTTTSIANFALQYMDPSTHPNILLASQTNVFLVTPVGFRLGGFYPALIYTYGTSMFTNTDNRRRLISTGGTVIDSVSVYVKYAPQPNQPGVGVGRYDCFTMEEVLLNRAEANLKKANPDIAAAMRDVEEIRKKRFTSYTPLSTTGLTVDQALTLVLRERRLELLGQGLRWYDVKRLGIQVEHRLIRYAASTGTILVPNDKRTALQIPLTARIGNPALENQLNPR